MPAIIPEPGIGLDISSAIHAELNLCYTCGSCAAECPVNRATDKLQPLKAVRMVGLGMIDDLLGSPAIWYCLSCNRCGNTCPMTVKPGALLSFFRKEAERRGYASRKTASGAEEVIRKLHRVRWHAVSHLKEGKTIPDISTFWDIAADTPVPAPSGEQAPMEYPSLDAARFRKSFSGYLGRLTNINSCYTCCECTNACPVFRERSVFDPMRLFRMVNLGLRDDLLSSPSIWLCLGCQSCTASCGQLVRGHLLLKRAQELAVEGGFVDGIFPDEWREVQKKLFTEYTKRIDMVLNDTGFAAHGKVPLKDPVLGEPGYEIVHKKPIRCPSDARYGPSL